MANPGDTVYELGSTNIDLAKNRCDVLIRYGVLDTEGHVNYRSQRVSFTIDNTRTDAIKAIIAALVAANLPDFLTGAVPA